MEDTSSAEAIEEAIEDLLLNTGLYQPVAIGGEGQIDEYSIRTAALQFDAYCVGCEAWATFHSKEVLQNLREVLAGNQYSMQRNEPPPFTRTFQCTRAAHEYYYSFAVFGDQLIKYGQYPSLADIGRDELKRYKRELGDDFPDLTRADDLFSHGVGAGALVYLRRIFEHLITRRHAEALQRGEKLPAYRSQSIDYWIRRFAADLPEAMAEHSDVYGLLSAGVHALPEETCRKLYPVVRMAIIDVAEQEREKREAEQRRATLKRDLAALAKEIKSGAGS